ncbi:MAG: peptidoglycan DD-metalloendopeptidase family protein [Phaeodactylibacter sp.]|nr:peptidoglycan DD-metalloendopeptidase family protein [Phaeodactylibacter sp.]MCB9265524.1 peptidoglycan DD-metalloendopeptidase family protein [Lewinellaceae bacterium]MCB9288515.1 peptidoglycan DD-metalloendopeptidase family protein [Lewinellaceae bacterium]
MDLPESFTQILKQKRKLLKIGLSTLSALLIGGTLFYFSADIKKSLQASLVASEKPLELGSFPVTVPTLKYGFAIDTFQVLEKTIEPGQFLADILLAQQLDYPSIDKIVANSAGVFDVRRLRVGKPYTILTKDSTQQAEYLIYEPNVYEYVVFELKEDKKVTRHEREITTEVRSAAGTLETSLWNAIVGQGLSYDLAAKMEDALQWSIDFHHLQKDDEFKLVYDQEFIEGKEVGIGQVHAAYYKTGENEYHAIFYDNGKTDGYYDLEGRPMKRGFLKSPVKYSRISSYYNLNRFHPILKRRRPHYGTDYAAPYGTPIYAVGDGVVIKASYTKGNGNFVKIKHDDTYQTQYLHMQKFAKGISSGVHVKQGQVIGYVGSTGLATGPHVCFRFWKNGKQVNHLNLKFPPAKPLPDEDMPRFTELRDKYMALLEKAHPVKVEDNDASLAAENGNP